MKKIYHGNANNFQTASALCSLHSIQMRTLDQGELKGKVERVKRRLLAKQQVEIRSKPWKRKRGCQETKNAAANLTSLRDGKEQDADCRKLNCGCGGRTRM